MIHKARIAPRLVFAFDRPRQFMPILTVAFLFALLLSSPAFADPPATPAAQTLGDMTENVYDSLLSLQTFLGLLSYILGGFFTITGLQQWRAYVEDPNQNPAGKIALRMAAAAFFIYLPSFANLLVQSIGGSAVGTSTNLVNFKGVTTVTNAGDGLEGALVRFVKDFAKPFFDNILPFFCYVCGIIFMLVGLKRLALSNGDGPQAPGGLGTMSTFLVGAFLLSFGYIMYTFNMSLFGLQSNDVLSNPLVDTGSADMTKRTNEVMWGVFIFLRIVGYVSVLRGLFMLRASGEGKDVSMMAVTTHIVAGALLANGTAFVLAAQRTFVDQAHYVLK